jgi:two-component system sensor histidine kinase BaeS
MAEMLARTEEFRRQWVSDSSHELRTPIAVLRAEIEALQDGVRTTDEKTLARLHKHVMQMSKLVDDLRQTLDRDSGQADLTLASIEPLALLRETLEEFLPRFTMATVTLDTSALPQNDLRWRMQGDADRLQQVFANLLENTLRYTHPGGRLNLSATARTGYLQLQFDDTPPAPPEQAIPRLFERFFRAEPSRSREHGGSGLGLAICKTIVEGHGGTISAGRSRLGGLCIRIDLPLER